MQYYTYNDNLDQNEYQKIFVDSITQKDRIVTIGKLLFEIFTTFSSEPPVGALPLNGYEITECNTKLPEFWNECVRRKKAGVIPCVINDVVYTQIALNQNGNCGYFYIEDNLESTNYGTVKLPCLSTAVLANITLLKEVNGIIQTSGEIISSEILSGELGAYYKGNNISHKHTGTTSDNYFLAGHGGQPYAAGGPPELGISNGTFKIDTRTPSVTILDSGLSLANPAHIKVYYWIQVFTSYITQDLSGKLSVSSNNTSGYIESLNPSIENRLPNIVKNLLPTISSYIAALILNSLNVDLELYYRTLAGDILINEQRIYRLRDNLLALSASILDLKLDIPQNIIQNILVLTDDIDTLSSEIRNMKIDVERNSNILTVVEPAIDTLSSNVNALSNNVNVLSTNLNRKIEGIEIDPESLLANFLTVGENSGTKTGILTTKLDMPTGIIKLLAPQVNSYEAVDLNIDIDNNVLQNIKTDIYSISTAMNNKIENIVVDDTKLLANFILILQNNSTVTLSMPPYIPTGIIEITDNGIYDYNMYATKQCSAAIALTENNY